MTSSLTSATNSPAVDARQLGLPNIAFIGKAGAGKTTAAELLVHLGYRTLSFAAPIKRMCRDLWGLEAQNDRARNLALGAAMRQVDPEVWVNLLLGKLAGGHPWGYIGPAEPTTVDDCRMENEWDALKAVDFVIVRVLATPAMCADRLRATGKEADEEDETETALDHRKADHTVINDGPRSRLYDDLVDVVIKERRKR